MYSIVNLKTFDKIEASAEDLINVLIRELGADIEELYMWYIIIDDNGDKYFIDLFDDKIRVRGIKSAYVIASAYYK